MSNIIRVLCVGVSLLFVLSCIPEIIPYEYLLDTPSRHYKNGMKLFQVGKTEASAAEFNRSLEIDREYAPGYVGLGLISGLNGDYSDAMKKMTVAGLYTRNRNETALVHVGFMRVYLMGNEKITMDWLEKVEEHHAKSILLVPEIPDAYFFMGLAYQSVLKLDKASEQFFHVIEINGDFTHDAVERMLMIQEIKAGS